MKALFEGCSFQLTPEMIPQVYLAAHQLRVETIFKACSEYLAQQLNAENCLSKRDLKEIKRANERMFRRAIDGC